MSRHANFQTLGVLQASKPDLQASKPELSASEETPRVWKENIESLKIELTLSRINAQAAIGFFAKARRFEMVMFD
jgi:hypothetical protein